MACLGVAPGGVSTLGVHVLCDVISPDVETSTIGGASDNGAGGSSAGIFTAAPWIVPLRGAPGGKQVAPLPPGMFSCPLDRPCSDDNFGSVAVRHWCE